MSTHGGRPWLGWWIAAIGAIHTIFGLTVYSQGWTAIAQRGFWSSVDGDVVREHAFWFTFLGPILMLLGALMVWVEQQTDRRLPKFLGWSLLALAGVALLLMPVSGFWLFIPLGVALVRR